MCRYVIEHPRFIPAETLHTVDPMAGRGAGRIYRVRPREKPPRAVVRFDRLDTAGLVAALDSPNGPQRDLAQQMLVARADAAAVPALEKMVAGAMRPESRLQALCTLAGLDAVNERTAIRAIRDKNAGVRRHAIRISEPLVNKSTAIGAEWTALIDDADPQVQLQLAYSLGTWSSTAAKEALAHLAWDHHADSYLLTAALSSVDRKNAADVMQQIISRAADGDLPAPLREAVITIATKVGDDACFRDALAALSRPHGPELSAAQLETLADLLGALSQRQRTRLLSPATDPQSDLGRIAARRPDCFAGSRNGRNYQAGHGAHPGDCRARRKRPVTIDRRFARTAEFAGRAAGRAQAARIRSRPRDRPDPDRELERLHTGAAHAGT